MRVRLTTQISGTRDGREWPAPGTVIDLPDSEAHGLLTAGTAVEPGDDPGTVMVPPAGVHQPYLPDNAEQALVEAPADALSDPEGTKRAVNAAAEGDVTGVPVGVGVQHPDGSARTPAELDESVKAEQDNRKRFEAESPKVGEKTGRKAADK